MKTLKWILAAVAVLLVTSSCANFKSKKNQGSILGIFDSLTDLAEKKNKEIGKQEEEEPYIFEYVEEEEPFVPMEAMLRDDIVPPSGSSLEEVSFPSSSIFISSDDNFTVKGAMDNYFAYVPDEHWGVLIMHYENGSWARRYVYCTGWDRSTKTLSFDTYDQKSGKYIGVLEGTFKMVDGKYQYTAVFTNYKGARSATFYMVED